MDVHHVSQRRASDVLQVDSSSVRYMSRRGDDAALRDAVKRVSRERRRFGCRHVHVMIARGGGREPQEVQAQIHRREASRAP